MTDTVEEKLKKIAGEVDDLAGRVAALIAIEASRADQTAPIFKQARGLIGSLLPRPLTSSARPLDSANDTLAKLEQIAKQFSAMQSAGKPRSP
jgi:hypothetical protein